MERLPTTTAYYKALNVFKVIKDFWAFLGDNATYGTHLSTDTTTFRDKKQPIR